MNEPIDYVRLRRMLKGENFGSELLARTHCVLQIIEMFPHILDRIEEAETLRERLEEENDRLNSQF